jgi:NAD(P)H dehydrogenase (quinone)
VIAVMGSAGKTGRAVVRALARDGAAVRGVVRRPEQRGPVLDLGAREAVVADLRDGAAVRAALDGVRAVYHLAPNVHPDEELIGTTVIAAAGQAGVERFVFHSVLHPQVEEMPHHWTKLRVEERLFASVLAYTVLQPGAYVQNVLGQLGSVMATGIYPVPYAVDAPFALVDLEDVAEAAASVLTGEGHAGATYELAGSHLVTMADVAAALTRHLQRPIVARRLDPKAWASTASSLTPYTRDALHAMFRYYDRHGLVGNGAVLRMLLGRPPTGLDECLRRELAAATV